jgi:hypothetical protein
MIWLRLGKLTWGKTTSSILVERSVWKDTASVKGASLLSLFLGPACSVPLPQTFLAAQSFNSLSSGRMFRGKLIWGSFLGWKKKVSQGRE